MKKKCMAIAKKAMVWALAASMLVATPLTASAAGLRGVYKIEDDQGKPVGKPAEDDTRTGTVSSTGTQTGVLNNESKILGIALDQTDVKMVMNGAYNPGAQVQETLKASIIFADGVKDEDKKQITEQLQRSFRWTSGDRDTVTVSVQKDGQPKDDKNTDTVTLSAKAGGNTKVTVSLDRNLNDEEIHFTATANVFVKQYVDSIANKDVGIQYVNHTLEISKAFVKTPETANEEIVYDIAEQFDGEGKAKSGIATLKNGVLTFKKVGTVKVIAVTEKGKTAENTITIAAGNPAKKVEFIKHGDADKKKIKKDDLNANEGKPYELEAVLTPTKEEDCTDTVTSWSAKKAGIVEVADNGNNVATLTPVKVGSTQIIAQTSNGKKGTFTINVKATLSGLRITTESQDLWSGQTLQLKADKLYGDAEKNIGNDKLKWVITNNAAVKNYASINATTGLLTIKPDVSTAPENLKINITVQSAKKIGDAPITAAEPESIDIGMLQTDVDKIVVSEVSYSKENEEIKEIRTTIADVGVAKKATKGSVKIAVGKNKTYEIVAYKGDSTETSDGTPLAATLNLASAKASIAEIERVGNDAAKVTAVNKGKSTITVSGVQSTTKGTKTTYKALKATFTAEATKPTTTITLTTKTKAVKATAKAQTVTYKATLDKNTTSKTKDIKWDIAQKDSEGKLKTECVATIKNGKVTIPKNSTSKYEAGDQFVITATLKDTADKSSVTATATIKVVAESESLAIYGKTKTEDGTEVWATYNKNKTTLDADSDVIIKPQIKVDGVEVVPGTEEATKANAADVDLTVNKAGIVQISRAKDGTYKVYGIKKGSVKITATTTDGKKATLTVTVSNPSTN